MEFNEVYEKVSLENIFGGGLNEIVQEDIKKVMENIYDPNTDKTAKREINIKIVLAPQLDKNDNVQGVAILGKTKVSLCSHKGVISQIFGVKEKGQFVAVQNRYDQDELFKEEPIKAVK